MSGRRVAITGLGVVSPLGTGLAATWEGLLDGRSAAGPLTRFDADGFGVRIAAQADDFDPRDFLDARDVRRSDRFCQMGVAAAAMAVEDAGWDGLPCAPERTGVVVGSGIGGLQTLEDGRDVLRDRGPRKLSPYVVPLLMINSAAGAIAMRFGATGPNWAPVSACASGAHSVGEGLRLIRNGSADAVLAGGSEAAITPLAVAAFASMGALSKRNDDPARASRPFDAGRDGFVLGEGAAVLVLEEWEAAQRRGARVYAELAGYGASADAFHMTQPDPDGEGALRAMRDALADAGAAASSVGYVNAHGTSTPYNDRIESTAIIRLFGERPPAVSSTKSCTGHLLGAAGAVEAAVTAMALHAGVLPPTINYETPDPQCALDCIPNTARAVSVDTAISNSFGFGGHNASLVLRRAG